MIDCHMKSMVELRPSFFEMIRCFDSFARVEEAEVNQFWRKDIPNSILLLIYSYIDEFPKSRRLLKSLSKKG